MIHYFLSLLDSILDDYKLKTTNSKAFIEVVNKVTSEDYNWFFDQYLYKNKVSFLEYTIWKDDYLYYRWTYVDGDYKGMPAEVKIRSYKNESIRIYPTNEIQRLKVAKEKSDFYVIYRYTLFGKSHKRKLKRLLAKQNKY